MINPEKLTRLSLLTGNSLAAAKLGQEINSRLRGRKENKVVIPWAIDYLMDLKAGEVLCYSELKEFTKPGTKWLSINSGEGAIGRYARLSEFLTQETNSDWSDEQKRHKNVLRYIGRNIMTLRRLEKGEIPPEEDIEKMRRFTDTIYQTYEVECHDLEHCSDPLFSDLARFAA